MQDPEHLRELAARMFILSIRTPDEEFAARLVRRALKYLDQAAALGNATYSSHLDSPSTR
jgi:hypothetical protein